MEYFEPNFIGEALVVLDRFGERAKILAGGTLLGPQLRAHRDSADALVNVKRIRDLGEIRIEDGMLRIGALATARTIASHPLVVEHAPLLALAAESLGAPQLRSSATIGGNVLSGHHAADLACALLAIDATASLARLDEPSLAISVEQMLAPGFSGLRPGTLLTGFSIEPAAGDRCAFQKMQTRQAFELALVSTAVVVRVDHEVVVVGARIAVGGAARTPIRAVAAERSIVGNALTDANIAKAANAAESIDAEPVDDERASAAYRRRLVRVLVERALSAVRSERKDA